MKGTFHDSNAPLMSSFHNSVASPILVRRRRCCKAALIGLYAQGIWKCITRGANGMWETLNLLSGISYQILVSLGQVDAGILQATKAKFAVIFITSPLPALLLSL